MIDLLITGIAIFTESGTEPGAVDVAIHEGKIVRLGKGLDLESEVTIDGSGCLLIPGMVESHIHLDIALMNEPDRPGRPEPYLSHYQLNETLERRRRKFTHEDIVDRATRALELASRKGVTSMRAQCHIDREVGLKHLQALLEARDACSAFIDVDLVAFPQQGLTSHPDNRPLFEEAFAAGIDVMGCAPNLDRQVNGAIRTREHIDLALDFAVAHGVDLDTHVDLGLPDICSYDQLESSYLAEKTIERGYQGRVTAGHLSSLGCLEPDEVAKALELFKAARLHVISQPDLYRLGRDDVANSRRGLTRVKELLKADINVSLASNNVRDALRPMGNFDLLEEALILAYGAHMDSVEEFGDLLRMCTYNGARILGLAGYGVGIGCVADLVVLDCKSPSAAIVSQAERRAVIKNGRLLYGPH